MQPVPPRGAAARIVVWTLHLAAPMLGLWLVLGTAVVSVGLAVAINEAARRRADARLSLVALVYLASAAFLGLHAAATPGMLLPGPNAGFAYATPVGLTIAAVIAAISSVDLQARRSASVLQWSAWLRAALVAAVVGWGGDGGPPCGAV